MSSTTYGNSLTFHLLTFISSLSFTALNFTTPRTQFPSPDACHRSARAFS